MNNAPAVAQKKFSCPACGGEAQWNPAKQALVCPFCGNVAPMTAPPEGAHFLDHATVLVDLALKYGWVATVQTDKHLILGYVFRRTDYPWVQNWGNYPSTGKFSRGLEFSTQPYDEPRREAVGKNGMFGSSTFRWLPAKAF